MSGIESCLAWLIVGLGAWAVGGCVAAWLVDRYGRRRRPHGRFDAIVIAGCRVRDDGTPTLSLERRARLAAELWHAGRAPRIIATGASIGGRRSEAEAAFDVLRAADVPVDVVTLEQSSTTTKQNAQEAAKLVRGRVLVVTDSYHVLRCERIFRRYFEAADGIGSTGPRRARIKGALREVVALAIVGLARGGRS